ncbi:MAG: tetratricopeptide repeat protein, partial [Thaumarchaeota archaeon]|nr:tetratricopeptide repeat protein [Nitrososphaerota archaeon]
MNNRIIFLILLLSIIGLFLPPSFALTPAADLTGEWSGFFQFNIHDNNNNSDCSVTGKINAEIIQNDNQLDVRYKLVANSNDCWLDDYNRIFGTIDGSRISLNDPFFGEMSGWFASSGIKLESNTHRDYPPGVNGPYFVPGYDLTFKTQLSRTDFTLPTFETKLDQKNDSQPQNSYDWNELGRKLHNQERYSEAIDAYEKAISIDPNYKWAWYNKGIVLNNLEKYENAIVVLNQVLRIDPNYEGAYFEKGLALGELGRHEEAIPVYLKELQLNPIDKWALNNLGWGLNELGRHEEALSYLDRSLKIDPTNTVAQKNKAIALKKLQKQEDSKAMYNGWITQGSDQLKNGNFDDAIKNFDLAYKENPNDQNLINLKAEALRKKGMWLVEEGKLGLGVIFLGESNYLKPDEYTNSLKNNAYNRWAEDIKMKTIPFDQKGFEEYNKGVSIVNLPPLPILGKVSSVDVDAFLGSQIFSSGIHPRDVTSGDPLKIGDIVVAYDTPVTLDWGDGTTILKPGTVIMVGTDKQLQNFVKVNPHYVELIEGQFRLYHKLNVGDTYSGSIEEETSFLVKTGKNLQMVGGTDVTFSHNKITGVSSIQIDDGWVEIFDITTNELKKFGVDTKLVTNNDGYFLVEPAAAELDKDVETSEGGGCLIATA